MARCGCAGQCNCVLSSSPSVQVVGNGTADSPYQMLVQGPEGSVFSVDDIQSDGSGNVDLDTTRLAIDHDQVLTTIQQDYGLKNLNTVRVVEPEQFASAANNTDDKQFSAAIAAVAPVGGMVRLRPGKTYTWTVPPTPFNFNTLHLPLYVEAWGSIINCAYSGSAWDLSGNTPSSTANSLVWLGGEVNNSVGDGIVMTNVGKAFFFRIASTCPNGSGWISQNSGSGFSENNHWIECSDFGCKHAITWQLLPGATAGSFARTVVRSLRLFQGTAGEPKLNIGDGTALYGGLIDGLSGNLSHNAVLFRVAGNQHGLTVQGNCHIEVSVNGINSTGTWTTGSSFISCTDIRSVDLGYSVSGTGLSGYVGTVTPGVGFVLSSSSLSTVAINPTANGTAAALTTAPFSNYFTTGTLAGGERLNWIAPLNVNAQTHFCYEGSPSQTLYGYFYPGYNVATGDNSADIAVGQCVHYTVPHPTTIALPANTDTTVFTLNVAPGEYILRPSICVNFTTASTPSNVQMHVTGGTASYSLDGQTAGQTGNAGASNTTQQTAQLALHTYLTVTASGTVTVTARASSVANVLSQTSSGYNNASGYILQRVA